MTFSNPIGAASAHAKKYVAALLDLLGDRDPVTVQKESVDELRKLVDGLRTADVERPEAPGKWSISQVIRHLAQTEIVYAYRYRITVAHDRPNIPGFDQELWNDRLAFDQRDIGQTLERLQTLREWNLDFLRSLPEKTLQREGKHEERGWESLSHQIKLGAAHDLVHRRQIERIRNGLL